MKYTLEMDLPTGQAHPAGRSTLTPVEHLSKTSSTLR